MTIPTRSNGDTINASWFNTIKSEIEGTQTTQGITRDSGDITVQTTTSGNVLLNSADDTVIISSGDATNATTQTIKFGDDTGGIAGIRNNSGTIQVQSSGGGWNNLGGSSKLLSVTSKSANYVVLDDDGYDVIIVTAGSTTMTLPTLADNIGRVIEFKKTNSAFDIVTIDGEGAETIDGALTKTLVTQNESLKIVGVTGGWQILERRIPSQSLDFTPTASWSTNTNWAGSWKRVGDTIHYKFSMGLTGTPDSATLSINLPSGHVIDTTNIGGTANANFKYRGLGTIKRGSEYVICTGWKSTTDFYVRYLTDGGTGLIGTPVDQSNPGTFASGDELYIEVSYPIVSLEG